MTQVDDNATVLSPEKPDRLTFEHLPDYCRYLLDEKLEPFARMLLEVSREVDVPLLRLLEHMPEEELFALGLQGTRELLEHFTENRVREHIETSLNAWRNDDMPIITRAQVMAADITRVSYARKHAFLSFVADYTKDLGLITALARELDRFVMEFETQCFDLYANLVTAQLQQSETLYKQAQAISRVGNWSWDIANNRITWTDELYRIYGLEPQSEVVSYERFVGFIHPDDRSVVIAAVERAMENHEPYEYYHRIVRDDGTERMVLGKGEVITNADGGPVKMIGTGQDITEDTERRHAEQKLKESEQRFRTVADSAPVLIWVAGTDRAMQYVNRGWSEFTGDDDADKAVSAWLDYVHADDAQPLQHAFATAYGAREEFQIEFRLRRRDGQYRWMLNHGVPRFSPDGTFEGYIGSCIEIHDRKVYREELEQNVAARTAELQIANRELERSNKELTSFGFVASHDLQEPLRKIQTFSTRILEKDYDNLSETGKDSFIRMNAAAARMKRLIEDLLSYSRTSSEPRVFETVDLNTLLNEVKTTVKELPESRFQPVIHVNRLPTVNGVRFQLHQLFENLVGNAVKYSKPNVAPRVEIEASVVSGDTVKGLDARKHYHRIAVTDNGIGFEPRYADKIFEMFQRLHGKAQYSGTGIGLAICKKIVENHNGIITADAVIDVGASFVVYLPMD